MSRMTDVPRESLAMSDCGVSLAMSKTVGTMTDATARASKLAAVWATVVLKYCSWRRMPPKKKHSPNTSKRLERMLPISEVWTMMTSS